MSTKKKIRTALNRKSLLQIQNNKGDLMIIPNSIEERKKGIEANYELFL